MSMTFPPIKPDRCVLWITLHADGAAPERFAALEAVLKTCRLHPLDMTASAELVIVEEAAVRAQLDALRGALGPGDRLHLISAQADRLSVEVIAAPGETLSAQWPRTDGPRPPWRALS
ncbi:MAG: hypothetical protein GX613_17595 [Chloroflexi bacterium]|nr:hypothetical protein [Chloroflexota bacterium]